MTLTVARWKEIVAGLSTVDRAPEVTGELIAKINAAIEWYSDEMDVTLELGEIEQLVIGEVGP